MDTTNSQTYLDQLIEVKEELENTPLASRTVEGKFIIDPEDLSDVDLSTKEVDIKAYKRMTPEQMERVDSAFDKLESFLKKPHPNQHLSPVVSL